MVAVAVPATAALSVGGASFRPIPADLSTPVQQRLAYAGPDSMSVGWNTYARQDQSCVTYGTSSSSLPWQACSSNSQTYATSRTWYNTVTLTRLKPATTYHYKIVSGNSSVEHFVSPRTAGDLTPFNMDVVIDLGVYGPDGFTTQKRDSIPTIDPALEHSTIGRLATTINDYELVIHPGDFAYADDWYLKTKNALDGEAAYEAILENFYDQLAPIAGRKAYMASPGNHEAACREIPNTSGLCPEGQKNFTDFMVRFGNNMPAGFPSTSNNSDAQANATRAKTLAVPPFWYSFEYGMVHVVMFNTETDFPNAPSGQGGSAGLNGGPFGAPGQQLAWLEADLASVDRSITPWVVAAGHRPWYSTGADPPDSNICAACQAAFEDLFYKYGVDIGVFGHVHNSQRFLPVYNNTADPADMNDSKAPMYIVTGGAGNIEGLSSVGKNYSTNVFAYADDFSYAALKFKDAQHLGVDFINSRTGEVVDSSTLYKAHITSFVRQS
ncbi:unnamed protein product [Zymoseptoria tritici ST99CH_1E4]|uniref:Purple acid phosphatase n=1 Tax=Zymoseptoria tritici ST99CH_1E4 TaxID=1276532 RepID=A0A2H1FJ14_ZYMTR|nr:unnamed protein product [Zymoseptoria tritici ST99CH_1E4]